MLLFLQVPISFGMAIVGTIGFGYYIGFEPAFRSIGNTAVDTVLVYDFSVLPLFILMGNFVARSGISHDLYEASNAWLGHFRGGLAMATVVACGGFSAVCGSSLATVATMSKVAIPLMQKYGYDERLATGSVAAGGTLGILIPPSVALVFYGIMTETDIGALFAAGIIPGLLGILLYAAAVAVMTRINPELGPRGEKLPLRERIHALRGIWGMLLLFIIVMGGIYGGIFTPTEAGAAGAFGALIIGLLKRKLDRKTLWGVLVETGHITVSILFLILAANIYSRMLALSGLPQQMGGYVGDNFTVFIIVYVLILILLGMILDSISIMLIILPLALPSLATFGGDPIWFGVVTVIAVEIGLLTPPLGITCYVVKSTLNDDRITLNQIFLGAMPFAFVMLLVTILLIAVPELSLVFT